MATPVPRLPRTLVPLDRLQSMRRCRVDDSASPDGSGSTRGKVHSRTGFKPGHLSRASELVFEAATLRRLGVGVGTTPAMWRWGRTLRS